MSDEPQAVTKRRRWEAVVTFDVDDTPDPAYDVTACEMMLDQLTDAVDEAMRTLAPAEIVEGSVEVDVRVIE